MIKIIKYGMSIHPGNLIYAAFSVMGFIAGLQNKNAFWYIGLVMAVVLLPLYIITSYSVGKANWDFNTNKPKD